MFLGRLNFVMRLNRLMTQIFRERGPWIAPFVDETNGK